MDINSIYLLLSAQCLLRKPPKEEDHGYTSVLLDFLGFSYKNILSYGVRDLLVILSPVLWVLFSLTRRFSLLKVKKSKLINFDKEILK